jgi:hypothetical protein
MNRLLSGGRIGQTPVAEERVMDAGYVEFGRRIGVEDMPPFGAGNTQGPVASRSADSKHSETHLRAMDSDLGVDARHAPAASHLPDHVDRRFHPGTKRTDRGTESAIPPGIALLARSSGRATPQDEEHASRTRRPADDSIEPGARRFFCSAPMGAGKTVLSLKRDRS